MAYETGSATSANDLLSKLRTFCLANGWTVSRYDAQGTGNRLQMQKASAYVNLRSLIGESQPAQPATPGGAAVSGIIGNLSTGYDAAKDWYNQPGALAKTNDTVNPAQFLTGGILRLSGAIPAYHFFSHSNALYVIVEFQAGYYAKMGFGTVQRIGMAANGEFYFSDYDGAGESLRQIYGVFSSGGVSSLSGAGYSAVRVDIESVNDLKPGIGIPNYPSLGNNNNPSSVFDTLAIIREMVLQTPNTLNSLSPLTPIEIFILRGQRFQVPSIANFRFSAIGRLPEFFYCNIYSLIPGSQISIGSDTYRVFPFTVKGASFAQSGSTNTFSLGYAIKSS